MTGLDTCIRKPLIATCGSDRSIRIWNYVDRSTDLCKVFSEECRSIAFHPSGLHVLCGFSDKLRLMNLLMDDIRPYKEFAIKGCPECRFSTGGHWFAAVNGNTIQIYSTYTCEAYGNLRGARRRAILRPILRAQFGAIRSPPHPSPPQATTARCGRSRGRLTTRAWCRRGWTAPCTSGSSTASSA